MKKVMQPGRRSPTSHLQASLDRIGLLAHGSAVVAVAVAVAVVVVVVVLVLFLVLAGGGGGGFVVVIVVVLLRCRCCCFHGGQTCSCGSSPDLDSVA